MLAIACYPFSKALELKIHASNEFNFSNQHQTLADTCFVLLGTHQWCPVLRDTFFLGMLCVAKPCESEPRA